MSWSAKTFWNNHSWPSSESIGNRGGIVPTKSGVSLDNSVWLFRDALTFSDVLIGIDFVRVRCELHKQSRLTFFKIQSEIHDGIGWPSRSSTWKHRVLFEVQPWHSQSSKWTYVILSIDILWCPDRQRPSETITLDLLQRQSGIAAESYQRNQAQRKILQRSSMRAPCDFFEMFWPSLISWSALTLSGVGCNLLKQSRLTFFKSKLEIHDGIGRSSRSPVWKHRVAFSSFTLDRHRGHHSAYQLLSSTLTFTDVLIGIDLVRGKMWPSETITFWLSSKSIENRTESGGTYQRNQAFRLTTACGFFEMPWPSLMCWSALTLSG